MNNLFEKGARWILAVILILLVIAIGVWFLPWFLAVKITICAIFSILAVIVTFVALFASGPQG